MLCIVCMSPFFSHVPQNSPPSFHFWACVQNALETSQTEFVEREIEAEKQVTALENSGRKLKVSVATVEQLNLVSCNEGFRNKT